MRRILFSLAAGCALLAATGSAPAAGPLNSGCSSCSTNSDSGACKPGVLDRLKCHMSGCGTGCNVFGSFCAWLKRPCPSSAPTLRQDYPLGFPSHPYIRSPRDFFMDP